MTREFDSKADAALLEELLEGRCSAADPRVRELFARRPDWARLAAECEGDSSAGAPERWSSETTADDQRLVEECLAAARVQAPGAAPSTAPAPRAADASAQFDRATDARARAPRRLRLLTVVLVAAAAAIALLITRPWSAHDAPPPRQFLGAELEGGTLDCRAEQVEDGALRFTWKTLGQKERFELTVRRIEADGKLGVTLCSKQTTGRSLEVSAAERAAWSERVVWRVDYFVEDAPAAFRQSTWPPPAR